MGFDLGETYAGYKFLEVAKRSKSGIEYRVLNTCAQRLEILRMLPKSAQEDREQNERFMRELRVRSRLVHPNIVTLFSAVELDRQLVMTTELVEGPTLAERLQAGPLPWRDAAGLICQALTAIAFAHEQRIVHRDITPENIVITPDGTLKLANFLCAKAAASPKLTQVGAVVGNLKYISPEQIKAIGDVDGRSDLYSLGIVFYEMLAGLPPFVSQSQFELMAAHVSEAPRPPSDWNPGIPKALDPVVLQAIAKAPSDRYQTAEAFGRAVSDAVTALDLNPPPPATQPGPQPTLAAPVAMAMQPVIMFPVPTVAPAVPAAPQPTQLLVPPVKHTVPAFRTTTDASAEPWAWVLYSGAAAVCVGLLLAVLWFTGR
jgi:serine/threonine-protein kinase